MEYRCHSPLVGLIVFPGWTAAYTDYRVFCLVSVISSPWCFKADMPVLSFFKLFTKFQNCLVDSKQIFLTYFLYEFLVAFLIFFLNWRNFSQSSSLPDFLAVLYALCLRLCKRFSVWFIQCSILAKKVTCTGACNSKYLLAQHCWYMHKRGP